MSAASISTTRPQTRCGGRHPAGADAHTYPLEQAVDAVADFGKDKLGELVVTTR